MVNGAKEEKAYVGFLEFKEVVKKNQAASACPTAAVPSGDKIGEAAKETLGHCLLILERSQLALRPLFPAPSSGTAQQAMKAVEKTIAMPPAVGFE